MSILRPTDAAPRLEKAQAADFLLEQLVENSVQILHGLGLSRIYEANQTQNWYDCEVIAKMGDKFEVFFPAINHKKIVTLKNLILKQITVTQNSDITLPILPNYASKDIPQLATAIDIIPEKQHLVDAPSSPLPEPVDRSTVANFVTSLSKIDDKPAVVLPPRRKPRDALHTAGSDSHCQSVPITLDDMVEATDSQHINLFDESFDNSSVVNAIALPQARVETSPCMPCIPLEPPSSISASECTAKSDIQGIPAIDEPGCINLSTMADMLSDLINKITPEYNTSLFGKRPSSCRLNTTETRPVIDAPPFRPTQRIRKSNNHSI